MRRLMKRGVILALIGLALAIVFQSAPPAQALTFDPTTVRYVCTLSTSCASGATTLITTSSSPTFDITVTPGATGLTDGTGVLHVVVLVPGASSSLVFSVNGSVPSPLSGTAGPVAATNFGNYTSGMLLDSGASFFAAQAVSTANPNFSAYASAATQAGIAAPTAFTVFGADFSITAGLGTSGPFTLLTPGGVTASMPLGSVFLAYLSDGTTHKLLTDSLTKVVDTTPLSSDLTVIPIPEPTSLLLLGSGLIGLGAGIRRRFFGEPKEV